MSRARLAALVGTVLLASCGSPPPPPPAPPVVPPRAAVAPRPPEAGPPLAPAKYEAKNRKDPFVPVTLAQGSKEGLQVASVKLAGIIDGRQGHLGLIEAPDGIGYILKSGDVLGDGRVSEITKDSLTFSVAGRPGQPPTTVTLRVRTD
jgi:hypothetical protein